MIFNLSYIGRTAASFPSRGATVKFNCRERQGRIVFAGEVRGNTRTRMLISWMWSLLGAFTSNGYSDLEIRAANQRSRLGLHTQENQ
jgi:hypothetical protein